MIKLFRLTILLIIPIILVSGCLKSQTLPKNTTTSPITFHINPSPSEGVYDGGGGNCVEALLIGDTFRIPIVVDNTVMESKVFYRNYTSLNFTVETNKPPTTSPTGVATIYFETQTNMTWNGLDILTKNNAGIHWANWTKVGSKLRYGSSGSDTTLYSSVNTYNLGYKFDGKHLAHTPGGFNTVGDTISWNITFHNIDWSWSQNYTVTLICIPP